MSGEIFGLTRAQRDTLLVIQELTAADGIAPSYDQIRRELEIASRGRICTIIDALVERGHVARLPRRRRSLVVLRPIPMPEEPVIVGFAGAAA